MSAAFYWEPVKTGHRFRNGTSSDQAALEEIFHREISASDVITLRAMHMASGHKVSLWSEIADIVEGLPEGAAIKVWVEY